jgi:O-antigen ligase
MRRLCFYFLLAFIFTLPWQEAFSIAGSRTISTLLGAGILFLTLTVVVAEWRLARPTPLLLTMILFAAWEVITLVWSIDPSQTQAKAITLVLLLAMVWLVGEFGGSRERRDALMQAFVLGCFVAMAALIQSWVSGVPVEGYRYAPQQFNLNETSDTIAVGIVMALILLARSKYRLLNWVNVAYLPLAILAVIVTGSRSGFIATCIALLGVPLILGKTRPVYRLAWLAIIITSFSFFFFAQPDSRTLDENLRRITFSSDTQTLRTMTGRTVIWTAGYSVFKEHPVTGIGAGTFAEGVGTRLDRARAAHNLFVSVAVETGAVGLALVFAVLISAVVPVVRARGEPRGLLLVLFAVLMAMGFAASVDTSKVMWLGLALLSLSGRQETPREE